MTTQKKINCDTTQPKLWRKKTWKATKLKNSNSNQTKKNSNCDNNSNCEKFKLKIVQPENLNSDKSISDKTYNSLLVGTTWHLNNQWDILWPLFCNPTIFFYDNGISINHFFVCLVVDQISRCSSTQCWNSNLCLSTLIEC